MIHGKEILLGLFLIIMGLSMFLMCLVYRKTRKMKYAWMSFGFLYTLGILMLMTDNPIKLYLQIPSDGSFYSITSIIILIIGIMLSFILLSKKGEEYVIDGILFSVGIHFLPFNSIYALILSIAVCINAVYFYFKTEQSIDKTLIIDALLKIVMGSVLLLI